MKKWFLIVAAIIAIGCVVGLVQCSEANAHPIYDQNGYVIGETLEEHYPPEMVQPFDRSPRLILPYEPTPEDPREIGISPNEKATMEELLSLLRECLEFIEDNDVDLYQWDSISTTLEYRVPPRVTRETQAKDKVEDAQAELDRLKRETALNKKIKQIIEQLQK